MLARIIGFQASRRPGWAGFQASRRPAGGQPAARAGSGVGILDRASHLTTLTSNVRSL